MEAFNKITNIGKNLLGMLIRDAVVYLSTDNVQYIVKENTFIYEWKLRYNLTAGKYQFINSNEFEKLSNMVKQC